MTALRLADTPPLLIATAIAIATAACAGSTPLPAAPAPVATNAEPTDPGATPPLPDGMRTYYVVLLRRGPAWTAEATAEARTIGAGHMAHIGAMAKAGKLLVAGPFLGQTDPTDFAGIYIFDVESLSATKALAEADPAVRAGRFVPEYLVWAGAKGLRTDYVAPPQDSEATPTTEKKKKGPPPCADRTGFDFWIGTWEVTIKSGAVAGHNVIERSERGCILVERWTSARGGTGTSMNYVDPSTNEWVQLWVDAGGGVIRLRGGLKTGSMELAGDYVTGKGVKSLLRGRWTPNADGSVRQHFEESKDDGKTWATWFDGTYRRK